MESQISVCLNISLFTRKNSRIKKGSNTQIQFHSFKHYTVNLFEQKLSKLNFPNYQNYNKINKVYNEFI